MQKDLVARPGPYGPVVLVLLVDRGRAGDHLAVHGWEDEDALRPFGRRRQHDSIELLIGRWIEYKELSLARIDAKRVVAGATRHRVRVKAGAVDHDARAYAFAALVLQRDAGAPGSDRANPESKSE